MFSLCFLLCSRCFSSFVPFSFLYFSSRNLPKSCLNSLEGLTSFLISRCLASSLNSRLCAFFFCAPCPWHGTIPVKGPWCPSWYAHIEIVATALVVNFFGFLIITRHHEVRFRWSLEEMILSVCWTFLNRKEPQKKSQYQSFNEKRPKS